MVATASVAISAEFVLVPSYEAFIPLLWVYRSRNLVSVDAYGHSIGFKLFTYTPAIDICYAGSRYREHVLRVQKSSGRKSGAQGSDLSSAAFRCAIGHVLHLLHEEPGIKQLREGRRMGFGNKEAIVEQGGNKVFALHCWRSSSSNLSDTLVAILRDYSFTIHDMKTVSPCKRVIFCGLEFSATGVKPCLHKITTCAEEGWRNF